MKNHKTLYRCSLFVSASISLLLGSCAYYPPVIQKPANQNVINGVSNMEARSFNLALGAAIERADRLVVKEHSHKVDFFGTIADGITPPQYVYKRKEMSTSDKMKFLEDVKNLQGLANMSQTSCMFTPHHTIDFYEYGRLTSSLKVSYKCSDVVWNGTQHRASKDVIYAVSKAITRAGMITHRAWDDLAKMRYEDANKSQTTDSAPIKLTTPTAKWATGQKGKKVINPFTGKFVDVEGIPANTKVRDPNDDDASHVFIVPDL